MCGICGLVYKDARHGVDTMAIHAMSDTISHRGPDDSGVYSKDNAGLGFRRLSIIDLSPAGHQPMSNEDGTVWIVFNGEIYNYLKLREELIAKGHIFNSRTDSETIVHLWEEMGERCVERLQGMFAFAIWDVKKQSLFLARDREGEKPLYYADLNDRIIFGSEIKAILASPNFQVEPNLDAIHLYLAYQSVPAPESAFRGIKKLPAAHSLTYREGKTIVKRYWKLSYADKLLIETEKEELDLQEEIIERLREAVRIRLMSEVPLGAFLSGGIDSSIVVALMTELMDQPVKTFSIGFDHDEYNELPYARKIAEKYETDHHEFIVTPDAQTIIPKLVWHYNEPFADSSAIPSFYVSQMARDYVTVVLTGDGGDENFAGYSRYQYTQSIGHQGLRNALSNLAARAKSGVFINSKDIRGSLVRLGHLTPAHLDYYLRLTHFHEYYQSDLYTSSFRTQVDNLFTVDWMLRKYQDSDAKNFLDATLDLDLRFYLPDTLMTKMDIASMAVSLETRAPMLDHEFLQFSASIPAELKLKNEERKYIFKKAVRPYLPDEIIHRKKMGFGVPLQHWFRGELKSMAYDTLLSKSAVERGYFDTDYVRSLLDRHQKGEDLQYLLWNLLMLELWHLMFIDCVIPQRTS